MPISVTELGIVSEVKPVHSRKASSPIVVTELGIDTEVKPLQQLKAYPPISVTELGIVVFLQPLINLFVEDSIIALQLLRESYTLFPLVTTILAKS